MCPKILCLSSGPTLSVGLSIRDGAMNATRAAEQMLTSDFLSITINKLCYVHYSYLNLLTTVGVTCHPCLSCFILDFYGFLRKLNFPYPAIMKS